MKKLLSVLVVMSMLIASLSGLTLVASAVTTLTQDADGYYLVTSADDFAQLNGSTEKFRLGNDFSVTASVESFSGTLDGNGKTINVTITGDTAYLGLFNKITDGNVSNLTITGSVTNTGNATSSCGTGSLAGLLSGESTVSDIKNYATVDALIDNSHRSRFAGIIGTSIGTNAAKVATIKNCINYGTIDAHYGSGGILGYSSNHTLVEKCINEGSVTGYIQLGGIVGDNYVGTISQSYNIGTVKGTYAVGGILGHASYIATVQDCFNKGSVTSASSNAIGNAGGIVGGIKAGNAKRTATVTNCYNIGTVSVSNDATIFNPIYSNYTTNYADTYISAINCYYLSETAVSDGEGEDTVTNEDNTTTIVDNTTPLTSEQMEDENSFNEWDFENIWDYDFNNPGYKYPQIKDIFLEKNLIKDSEGYYLISSASDFGLIKKTGTSEKYRLANDITEAITVPVDTFSGEFDGNGHSVNISLSGSDDYLALFKNVTGGKIYDLILNGAVTSTSTATNAAFGALVGNANGSGIEISGITSNVSLSGGSTRYTGIIGATAGTKTSYVKITDCTATEFSSSYAGYGAAGIVGIARSYTSIERCRSFGTVKGSFYLGGIVGEAATAVKVSKCFNAGTVSGTRVLAGIVGYATASVEISDCYNKGVITANNTAYNLGVVGGILGGLNSAKDNRYAIIKNCYNVGEVTSNLDASMFYPIYSAYTLTGVGSYISAEGCYYLSETKADDGLGLGTVTDDATGTTTTTDGTIALTSAEMSSLANFSGWDSSVWDIDKTNPGYKYPQLKDMYLPSCLEKDSEGYYIIDSAIAFNMINDDPAGDYRITADITEPITASIDNFSGTLIGWDREANKPAMRKLTIELDDGDIGYFNQTSPRIGLFPVATADISYLELYGSVTASTGSLIGGALVGNATGGTISNIINNADVTLTGSSAQAGGIVGGCYAKIRNCYNNADVKAPYLAGGIASTIANTSEITTLRNNGNITATGSSSYAAGLFAQARYIINLKNALNSGSVSGSKGSYAIIGSYHSSVTESAEKEISIEYFYDAKGYSLVPDYSKIADLSVSTNECYLANENSELLKDKEALIVKGWDFENVWAYDENNRAYKYPQLKGFFISTEPGTIANPMDIATPEEFFALKDTETAGVYYELVADIDLTEVEGYEPFVFNGTLYGNGKTIIPSKTGIFTEINGAEITGLVIGEAEVSIEKEANDFAALAWLAASSTLTDVTNYADVSANISNVGGLVGLTNYGKVVFNNCENHGDISSEEGNIGGLVGWASNGGAEINGGINTGNISGSSSIGGFVGNNTLSLVIKDAVNLGNIVSYGSPGPGGSASGFLGHHKYNADGRTALIENCYNAGIVSVLFDKKGYSRYNPVAAQYTTEKTSTLTVKDSYYLAVDTENDVDLYSGTTAVGLEEFNSKIAALGYSPIEASVLEMKVENLRGFVTPTAPSSKVYAVKGSDVVVTVLPDEHHKIVNTTVNGSPVVFTTEEDTAYYTYLVENISDDAVICLAFEEMFVADIILPEAAFDYEIKHLIGLANYAKIDPAKPVMLIYGKIVSGADKFEKLGITIGDAYDVEVNLNKDGEFAAFIYSSNDILTDGEAVSVKAYGINSDGYKLESVIIDASTDNSVNAIPFIIK